MKARYSVFWIVADYAWFFFNEFEDKIRVCKRITFRAVAKSGIGAALLAKQKRPV